VTAHATSNAPSAEPAGCLRQCRRAHGPALRRLARSYDADRDRQQDLLQEIHFALWRSFAAYYGRCSVRRLTYRVAHNVAASHVLHHRRRGVRALVSLDALEARSYAVDGNNWRDSASITNGSTPCCDSSAIVAGLSITCLLAHRKARQYQQEIEELDALRR
jgi:DNA-directed RNA polymerase specialized sigma24 family protein